MGGSLAGLWVADPAAFCAALTLALEALPAAPAAAWAYRSAWERAAARADAALQRHCQQQFFAGSVSRQLAAALPPGALLWAASSMAIRDLGSFGGRPACQLQVLSNRGTNGIDGNLSALLGASLAAAPRPLFGLLGDLALLHDVGALQAARQLQAQLNAVVLVVNNGGGGIFDHLPISAHPSAYMAYFRTPQQADLMALCAAAQLTACQVRTAAELQDVLREAQRPGSQGLRLIEVVVPSQPAASQAAYAASWAAVAAAIT